MTGDRHVRFYESRGVRFPPATHQSQKTGQGGPMLMAGDKNCGAR